MLTGNFGRESYFFLEMELGSMLQLIGVGKGRKEARNKPETPHLENLVKQCSGFDFSFVDIGGTVKIFLIFL